MTVQRNRRPKYTSTGRHSGYQVEIHHRGLGESKALSAVDEYALEAKIENQSAIWDKRWGQEQLKKSATENAELAVSMTAEYQSLLTRCESILEHTLSIDDTVDWETLKRRDTFSDTESRLDEVKYLKDGYPAGVNDIPLPQLPLAPKLENFAREITLIDRLFGGAKAKRATQQDEFAAAAQRYEQAILVPGITTD